ncbi:unnamed protein product [Brachionus calyciflorus]|uniref:Uncharacterized protein n=1 Tax=Brachionus calyciflorus TaxID=104777 RepID=A0A814IWC9_9BILA|nr:unnamed protein product [Brachionus calyciflorus]
MLRYQDFIETSTHSSTTDLNQLNTFPQNKNIFSTTDSSLNLIKSLIPKPKFSRPQFKFTPSPNTRTTIQTTIETSTFFPSSSQNVFRTQSDPLAKMTLSDNDILKKIESLSSFIDQKKNSTEQANHLVVSNSYEFLQVILLFLLLIVSSLILFWLCICTKKFLFLTRRGLISRELNQMPVKMNQFNEIRTINVTNNDHMLQELPRAKIIRSDSTRTMKWPIKSELYSSNN